ncbi:hypothetical protein [Branchiibius sp. NY16-3462-2]|nr:hypothetical protein [Branchiibius sp. NY16-3462-2]KYH44762.1 hypothetical protein AZH51_12105 [Branchiibius sp. NY16-3462-2]
MTTVDASGAIHASDGKFTGHIAGEADSTVSLSTPGGAQLTDRLSRAGEATLEMESYLLAMREQINEEMARLAGRHLALERAEVSSASGQPDEATQAEVTYEFDGDDSVVWIEPEEDGDRISQQFSMPADEVGAFLDRFAVPGTMNHDAASARIDLEKLRRELDTPGRPIDVVHRASNAGTDIASKRDLESLRDMVRAECPSGRFVALRRPDGSDYWQIDAVLDSDGADVDFDPCRMIGNEHPESLVQGAAETGFATAWTQFGGRDASLEPDMADTWDSLYEAVIDLDDLSRR